MCLCYSNCSKFTLNKCRHHQLHYYGNTAAFNELWEKLDSTCLAVRKDLLCLLSCPSLTLLCFLADFSWILALYILGRTEQLLFFFLLDNQEHNFPLGVGVVHGVSVLSVNLDIMTFTSSSHHVCWHIIIHNSLLWSF